MHDRDRAALRRRHREHGLRRAVRPAGGRAVRRPVPAHPVLRRRHRRAGRAVRRREHRRLRRLHVQVHAHRGLRRRRRRCGAEECDDGNTTSCDGCSAHVYEAKTGAVCGDGIVNAACGEQCDPPGPADRVQLPLPARAAAAARDAPLLLRRRARTPPRSAPACRSALPRARSIWSATRRAPTAVATVTVSGPAYFSVPILGGAFGYFCVRITSCTGHVYCNGGTPVGVLVEQDSAGPGLQGNPVVTTTGLGANGAAGTVVLTCDQSFIQVQSAGSRLPEPDLSTRSVVGLHDRFGDRRIPERRSTIGTGQITVVGRALRLLTMVDRGWPGSTRRLVPPRGGSASRRHGERPAARRLSAFTFTSDFVVDPVLRRHGGSPGFRGR